jgi:hypothetical protein
VANRLYPKGKEGLLDGSIVPDDDDMRFALIDTALITYNPGHKFLDDLDPDGIVAQMAAGLSSKTVTSGNFKAADPTIASVTGDTIEAVILYKHNADPALARLLAWIDSPYTPTGADVTLRLNAAGVFSL